MAIFIRFKSASQGFPSASPVPAQGVFPLANFAYRRILLLVERPLTYLERFKRQSRGAMFVYAIVLVSVIGLADYVTGYEVAFYPVYSLPILLMVWIEDTIGAVVISVLSALTWWVADYASGHPYAAEWLRILDMLVRLIFFGLVTVAGFGLRSIRRSDQIRIELLERAQELEAEIIEISERAQQRLGRDLHDGLCQYLAALGFAAVALKSGLEKDGSVHAPEAADLARAMEQSVVRAREVARGLSPVDRDQGGLESALEELSANTQDLAGISCGFIGDATELLLSEETAVHLFRIAQEAIGNAVKHSRATRITIALEATDDGLLSLRVSDDGIGMRPGEPRGNGMGLNIMRYRARKIGGLLEFFDNKPHGVVVSCAIAQPAPAAPVAPIPIEPLPSHEPENTPSRGRRGPSHVSGAHCAID